MISRIDVEAAQARIGSRIRRTPVLESGGLWMKLEHLQHTGSFKARGAFNRILSAAEHDALPPEGVVTASGGNAGLAIAYAARELGAPAEVFVPETAPKVKVDRLRDLGATVVQVGTEYADAYDAAVRRSGALFCHAYDQPEICAGQGTLALELEEQTGGVDTVLVAVGGGGLMAGIAAALESRARVVAVEPSRCPTLHEALETGKPVDTDVSGIAADSLGARRVGDIAFDVARRTDVLSVLVDDEALVTARRELWQRYRVAIEHGAAAAYAALLTGTYRPAPGERVALICCGANTNPTDLA